ncbi:MAG: acyl carrier protein [Eubacterium sp.]|jgi:Phosphopantetheine attachment site.|nr:acyl carrier protein [Eubacterium sp.]
MESFNVNEVEKAIIEVLSTVCEEKGEISMETSLADIDLKSIQLISVSALLEERLGYAPNFRALIGMEKVGDIRDYIMR